MRSKTNLSHRSDQHGRGYPRSRILLFVALALAGVTADLFTKSLVFEKLGLPGLRPTYWLVGKNLGIETAVNIGAVFGLGAGKGSLFAAFSVIAGVAIIIWLFKFGAAGSLWLTWALGMIYGGILGNLYDRLGFWWEEGMPPQWQSGVRDWILFRVEGVPMLDPWPNFNIADSLLVVGAGMLLIQSFWLSKEPTAVSSDATSSNDESPPHE